ncbi:MAG: YlmC/YmxH family sporulation protein [Clostridia bacterium]|nr:YlmC/YmxH family sporulation protein [Clostridia bacterium]
MSLSELRTKDVVNTLDGRRLGKVMDIEFDEGTGQVEALVVPGEFKMTSMLRGEKCGVVIPWQHICKIGENVILVDLDLDDLA